VGAARQRPRVAGEARIKIVISTFGVRGDVQPYLALAVGLQAAGHRVTLATSSNFTAWIESYGVGAQPARFDVHAFTQSPENQASLRSGNPVRILRMMRALQSELAAARDEVWAAMQAAECVIQSPTGAGALEAAEQRGLPAVLASPVPFAPTRAWSSFFMGAPRLPLPARLNPLSHRLMHAVLWAGLGRPMSTPLRRQLGLRPWRSFGHWLAGARQQGVPMLYGFSPHLLPRPGDWDEQQVITGYWFLPPPPRWSPDQSGELARFLASGPPPVYLGFGSMTQGDAAAHTHLALRALELSGQRGVLATGWGALAHTAAPPHVHFVDDVPHAWLFPQMAAVVHHGGAGTTGAGLRAGVPSLITPFLADQAAWAARVVDLGVGPPLPGIQRLTAEKLAAGLHTAVTDLALRARAAALGESIRAEDGLGAAVRLIEAHAARQRPPL
jgi:sterol 3beta-glucosyltransferase